MLKRRASLLYSLANPRTMNKYEDAPRMMTILMLASHRIAVHVAHLIHPSFKSFVQKSLQIEAFRCVH